MSEQGFEQLEAALLRLPVLLSVGLPEGYTYAEARLFKHMLKETLTAAAEDAHREIEYRRMWDKPMEPEGGWPA